jgi:hypothetical protein
MAVRTFNLLRIDATMASCTTRASRRITCSVAGQSSNESARQCGRRSSSVALIAIDTVQKRQRSLQALYAGSACVFQCLLLGGATGAEDRFPASKSLAAETQAGGCRRCGSALHKNRYQRKPRGGGLIGLRDRSHFHFSLSCSGCGKRAVSGPPRLPRLSSYWLALCISV